MLPAQFRSSTFRLSDGGVIRYRSGRLLALAWSARQKKKPLYMLSTHHSSVSFSETASATKKVASKPVVVDMYNHGVNGVDIADQFTVYYSFVRRCLKINGRKSLLFGCSR